MTEELTQPEELSWMEELDSSHKGEQDKRTVWHLSAPEHVLTGKLCQRMMALIQLRVGADEAVSDHVVWALKEWLRRRGITIYTDRVL
jgi:hypothetical protein